LDLDAKLQTEGECTVMSDIFTKKKETLCAKRTSSIFSANENSIVVPSYKEGIYIRSSIHFRQ